MEDLLKKYETELSEARKLQMKLLAAGTYGEQLRMLHLQIEMLRRFVLDLKHS